MRCVWATGPVTISVNGTPNESLRHMEKATVQKTLTALTPALLWATSASAQAGNKIIPYIIQAPDFSTWIKILNLCDSPASYRIDLIGANGYPEQLSFSDGELWRAVGNREEVAPGKTYSFSFPESEEEIRQAYGEITDDGDGCIAGPAANAGPPWAKRQGEECQ